MKIEIINRSNNDLPKFESALAAGMDLRAFLEKPICLQSGEWILVSTGIYLALPEGYEAQVRPRSGLAFKHGVTVLNSPGTIDADYRGEVKVMLINHGKEHFMIEDGERIAQLVVAKYQQFEWTEVDALSKTSRGEGGFGSTGKS
mgnify:CR=1 FL=1